MRLDWNDFIGDFDGSPSSMSADLGDGYMIQVTLEDGEDGVLICSGLCIQARDKNIPESAINSRYLQLLGLGEILKSARATYGEMKDISSEAGIFLDAKNETKTWPNPGSLGHPDKRYAQIAYLYTNLVSSGTSNPIDELAEHMNCDRETASSRVAEARNRELLTRPKQSVLGGRLTSKAEKLLGIKKG